MIRHRGLCGQCRIKDSKIKTLVEDIVMKTAETVSAEKEARQVREAICDLAVTNTTSIKAVLKLPSLISNLSPTTTQEHAVDSRTDSHKCDTKQMAAPLLTQQVKNTNQFRPKDQPGE